MKKIWKSYTQNDLTFMKKKYTYIHKIKFGIEVALKLQDSNVCEFQLPHSVK